MSDATTGRSKAIYKHISAFVDRNGHKRHYYRKPGFEVIAIKAVPGTPDFDDAYNKAVKTARPFFPASVSKRQAMKGDFAGVYFLFHGRNLTYIGSSANMKDRVSSHASNGRQFTRAFYLATLPNERFAVEREILRAVATKQNKSEGRVPTQYPKHLEDFPTPSEAFD